MSGAGLLGELSPKLENLSAAAVEVTADGVGLVERGLERSGGQNDLKVAVRPDLEGDVEQPVSKLDDGSGFDEKHGFKVWGRHSSTPRGNTTAEPSLCAASRMNAPLMDVVTPVEHIGWQATSMGFIPLFTPLEP